MAIVSQVRVNGSLHNLSDIEKAAIAGAAGSSQKFTGINTYEKSKVVVLGTTGTVTLTTAANVGVQNLIVATTGAVTYSLPTPRIGDVLKFNSVSEAIMGHNVIFSASGDDSVFFVGGLKHSDINADTAGVFSNGSSNAVLTLTVPTTLDITMIGKSTTEWYLFGSVTQTAAITIANN